MPLICSIFSYNARLYTICQIILTVNVASNLTEYPNSGKEAKGQSSSNVLKKNKQELVNITHNFCQPFEDLNLRNK